MEKLIANEKFESKCKEFDERKKRKKSKEKRDKAIQTIRKGSKNTDYVVLYKDRTYDYLTEREVLKVNRKKVDSIMVKCYHALLGEFLFRIPYETVESFQKYSKGMKAKSIFFKSQDAQYTFANDKRSIEEMINSSEIEIEKTQIKSLSELISEASYLYIHSCAVEDIVGSRDQQKYLSNQLTYFQDTKKKVLNIFDFLKEKLNIDVEKKHLDIDTLNATWSPVKRFKDCIEDISFVCVDPNMYVVTDNRKIRKVIRDRDHVTIEMEVVSWDKELIEEHTYAINDYEEYCLGEDYEMMMSNLSNKAAKYATEGIERVGIMSGYKKNKTIEDIVSYLFRSRVFSKVLDDYINYDLLNEYRSMGLSPWESQVLDLVMNYPDSYHSSYCVNGLSIKGDTSRNISIEQVRNMFILDTRRNIIAPKKSHKYGLGDLPDLRLSCKRDKESGKLKYHLGKQLQIDYIGDKYLISQVR